jgi:cytochrome c-type biogenesis protein CcmF
LVAFAAPEGSAAELTPARIHQGDAMTALGVTALWASFGAALVSIGALLFGHARGVKTGRTPTSIGYLATFAAAGLLTFSVLVMVVAFFREDFTLLYVAENHSTDVSGLAWLYKLSGVWAGREGSFLFWAWLISLYASFVAWRRKDVADALSNMGLMVTNVVLALFSAAMLFSDANAPFKATPNWLIDPATHKLTGDAALWGMGPLLQHWAMTIHPPMLFIGYAGLTIPFAFSVAALIVDDGSSAWVAIVDRITIFAWLFLGAGIGLGSVWAYVVLGWGGYWGWDPVENASLLPWLTGVAMMHTFTVAKRRGAFKRWAIVLAGSTFALVILGTFITRSGIVASVHRFAPDPVSLWLFGGMIVTAVSLPLALLAWRWKTLAGGGEFDSLASKEAAYYFNNVIMLVAGWLVAYLTVTSVLPKWLPLGGMAVPPSTYDAVARPVGIGYLAILAFCPLLAWHKTDWLTMWGRLRTPLVAAGLVFALLVAEWASVLWPIYRLMVAQASKPGQVFSAAGPSWYYNGLALAGFLVAAVLIANTLWLFVGGVRRRAEASGENVGAALWSIVTKARGQSGGYIAHIGMGVIMIGLIGSAMFVQDQTFTVKDQPGSAFAIGSVTFTYQGYVEKTLANGDKITRMNLAASRGGRQVAHVAPGLTEFVNRSEDQRVRSDATVLSEPLRDTFVVFKGASDGGLVFDVKINPLIWFTWAGFALLLLGTGLAAWPESRRL